VRPAILDKLFASLTALPGIGSQMAKLFERLAGPLVLDLLWHLPTGIVDRRASPDLGARNTPPLSVTSGAHTVGEHREAVNVQGCRISV